MSRQKIKYQQITFTIPTVRNQVEMEVETDRLFKRITGINVVLSDTKNKFSTIKLEIDSVEIFPTGFEILRVLFRDYVPFGFDYMLLNEKAEGSKIKFQYVDVPVSVSPATYPYNVIISLRLEND